MARILCVDDEPSVLTLKCSILEAEGYEVAAAVSAPDAVEKLRRQAYDLVITDWRLGNASGQAVVEAAKTRPGTPVIVVSGFLAEAGNARPAADLYLEKPLHPKRLVEEVRRLLER
ncbi:MAG TPA: response regulator [Terriglobales bacterium]|jgi:CheY-like chemotaxis protein|nr:response regulator [Terriglobales bacterium]